MKTYFCSSCNSESLNLEDMCWVKGTLRNKCKKCHRDEERIRIQKKTKEERQEISKKQYETRKKFYYKLDEFTQDGLEIAINNWINTCINKSTEKRFIDRKNLDKENLKTLCYKAREIFPYIKFNNFRDGTSSECWASLDRLDSTISYSDTNIIVVPFWLNSAKLDSSYESLFYKFNLLDKELFLSYVKNLKNNRCILT